MKKINIKGVKNCSNCEYSDVDENEVKICNRPLKTENRVATNLGNVELACPCHSSRDKVKKEGKYLGMREFYLSKGRLIQLEKLLFG